MAQSSNNVERYRRPRNSTTPFKLKPAGKFQSGSSWGQAELEWLAIDRVFDLDLEEIIHPKHLLPENCKISQSLRYEFRKPWSQVKPPAAKLGTGNFYTHLRYVASIGPKLRVYEQSLIDVRNASIVESNHPSSVPDGRNWSSSPPAPRAVRNPSTPKHLGSSPPSPTPLGLQPKGDRAIAPTPKNAGKINSILAKNPPTPALSESSGPCFPSSSPTPRYAPDQKDHTRRCAESPVDLPELPNRRPSASSYSGNPNTSGDISVLIKSALAQGEDILNSEPDNQQPDNSRLEASDLRLEASDFDPDSIFDQNSDPAAFCTPVKQLSLESQLKHQSEKLEDKAESEVEQVAIRFFEIIEGALAIILKNSVMISRTTNALSLPIRIEGNAMTTKPDIDLSISGRVDEHGDGHVIESTTHIYTECKRLLHYKSADEIFGQEVAHQIAAAIEQKGCGLKKSRYRKYLLSWHHTICYVSCFEVDSDYLDLISAKVPNRNKNPLTVRQSKVYNMTDPADRYQIAMAVVAIMVEDLADYGRYRRSGLLERLRD